MEIKTAHFQKGMIILWNGPVVFIPTGWQLCDGTNSTPDLRNNFIVGAGDTYSPDSTGGSLSHLHLGESGHSHATEAGTGLAAGPDYNLNSGIPVDLGDTGETSTMPPYYALAFIMKL